MFSELEGMWKEAVVSQFEIPSGFWKIILYLREWTEKNHDK